MAGEKYLPTERAMLGLVMAPKDPKQLFSDSEWLAPTWIPMNQLSPAL